MSADTESVSLDLSEKGRAKDGTPLSSNRRLFMQFHAFGDCGDTEKIVKALEKADIDLALYADINDPSGIGLIAMSEDPNVFADGLRHLLSQSPFAELTQKHEFTMLGRTYSFGYEPDLERTLVDGPRERVLDPGLPWVIWYPLRRNKQFETLSEEEQRSVLGEHGKLGFKFGKAGYAKDIRLACHGLDKNDNDFVIGILGKDLAPMSILIQTMRKTKQTSMYLESLGPFFIGRILYQSKI